MHPAAAVTVYSLALILYERQRFGPKRIVEVIADEDVSSVRDPARNVSVVSRDLDVLFEADIVNFEKDGRSKKPMMAHEHVVVEPLVLNGDVSTRDE